MIKLGKYITLVMATGATTLMCLWPDFHPEKKALDQYYWQVDILIHGGYYFLLTMLIQVLNFKIRTVYLFLLLTGFSFLLEGLQFFSYKRGVSLMDMGSNVLGIGLAVLVYRMIKKKKKQ